MLWLSVRQPWAWLIVQGWKNIENRDWPTAVRGRVLIHAAKSMTVEEYQAAVLFVRACGFHHVAGLIPPSFDLERGGIVGSAEILDCVEGHESEWFTGRFGFVLDKPKALSFRPLAGKLGFFKVETGGLYGPGEC